MVWAVYTTLQKIGTRHSLIPIDVIADELGMGNDLVREYILALQILELVEYDQNNALVKLVR